MTKNQLKSGVVLSYINLIISMLIPLFYTPVMLRLLGQTEYGLYSLSNTAVAYLSLLSFGFGSTIIRYIAKFRAENNRNQVEKIFGFFLSLYMFLAAIVFIVGIAIAGNVEPIFHKGLSDPELKKMKVLVTIMAFNSALSFPVSVFSSIITAYEKYIYRKIIDMFSTVAAPIANLFVLYMGYGSVGMSIAASIIQFFMLPLSAVYCIKVLKLTPKFGLINKKLFIEMLSFSTFIFVESIVDMLFWATDKVILGMLASSAAVAIYNVGGTFNNMVMNLSTSISGVLMPKLTGMVIRKNDPKKLTELFIKVGRLQFIIIGLIISGFTVFGRQFIYLWAGANYQDAYWVAIMTMFPLCVPLIQNTGHSIVVAQNKHQFRAIVYLVIAVLNVCSTYICVPKWGIIGAAFCSCIAYILGQGIIMNIYYYKVTRINIPLFWKNILRMAAVPGFMLILGLGVVKLLTVQSWIALLIEIICYTLIYVVLMFRFVMNDYEKELFLNPVRKILCHR